MAVKGAEKLMRQLNNLQNINPALVEAMHIAVEGVQGQARRYIPNGGNTGELSGSIQRMVQATEGMVIGTVYTNKPYAQYMEFGTGPKGEAEHNGISPAVDPTYSQSGWWFSGSESDIDPRDAQKYHWPSITTENGDVLYFTQGQPATPFMYPALKNNEENITRLIKAKVKAEIKKV